MGTTKSTPPATISSSPTTAARPTAPWSCASSARRSATPPISCAARSTSARCTASSWTEDALEPASHVYLFYPSLLEHAMDVPLHRWKWDIPAVMASYRHIEEKWKIDVAGPRGDFKRYLVGVNARVGPFTQLYPSRPTIFADRLSRALGRRWPSLRRVRNRFTAWRTGYYRACGGRRATGKSRKTSPAASVPMPF